MTICEQQPKLAEPITAGAPDLLVEALVAARFEQARTVADVFLRRTRLGLLAGRSLVDDTRAARRVAEAMAPELGWSGRQAKREASRWLEDAEQEGLVVGKGHEAVA
jgi:glycerol-3-phosphate dehydrogenase